MCNLYNVITTREAVLQFTKAFRDLAGWNEASFDVYPGYQAPIVRVAEDGHREIVRATWGMPSPPAYVKNYNPGVTNIRNVSSPHWRRWLGPASRCVVPSRLLRNRIRQARSAAGACRMPSLPKTRPSR